MNETKQSETPRTDAVEKNFGEVPGEMRKLEKELNEANRKLSQIILAVDKAEALNNASTENEIAASASFNECIAQIMLEQAEKENDLLRQERDVLRSEYESRAAWIDKMNKILGYDNSDGFHSEPDPFTIAENLVARVSKLDKLNS